MRSASRCSTGQPWLDPPCFGGLWGGEGCCSVGSSQGDAWRGVWGLWRRAARAVGSQACSQTRPLPALCVRQGLLEQQPWKAGVNLILDEHKQGLPVVPVVLEGASQVEQTRGVGSGSGPCGWTYGAGRGCTTCGKICGVVAGCA